MKTPEEIAQEILSKTFGGIFMESTVHLMLQNAVRMGVIELRGDRLETVIAEIDRRFPYPPPHHHQIWYDQSGKREIFLDGVKWAIR